MNVHSSYLMIILFICYLSIYRGLWNLMDKYLFPSNFLLSNILSIIIPLIVIIILSYKYHDIIMYDDYSINPKRREVYLKKH